MTSKTSDKHKPASAASYRPLYFAGPPTTRSSGQSPTPEIESRAPLRSQLFKPPKPYAVEPQQRSRSLSTSSAKTPGLVEDEVEPLNVNPRIEKDVFVSWADHHSGKPTELAGYSKSRLDPDCVNLRQTAQRAPSQSKPKIGFGMGNSILHNTIGYAGVQKPERPLRQPSTKQPSIKQADPITAPQHVTEQEAYQAQIDFTTPQNVTEQEAYQAQIDFTTAMQSVASLRTKIVDTLRVYGTKIITLEEKNVLQNRRIEALEAACKVRDRRVLQLEAEIRNHKLNIEGLAEDMDRLVDTEVQSESEEE